MNRRNYAGTWTALITPFLVDGSVDEAALRGLVRRQIEGGVTGIVPLGTTGESPTTHADNEDRRIFEICVDEADGRIRVMAGTGSNCTAEAVHHTQLAKAAGADCCLVVCPYYNKPTQEGMRLHFLEVAKVGLPVIVYNIKGRTGVNMSTDTLMALAENEMIVGVKEASGDLEQMREVISRRPEDFTVLSGDDGLTLDLIKMGGDGVVSVASNLVPAKVVELVEDALAGRFDEALAVHQYLEGMFNDIFVETNPIPVKYASHLMGLCEAVYRLPLCPPGEQAKRVIEEMVETYNLKFTI